MKIVAFSQINLTNFLPFFVANLATNYHDFLSIIAQKLVHRSRLWYLVRQFWLFFAIFCHFDGTKYYDFLSITSQKTENRKLLMFSWQKQMMMHVKTHFWYFFQHTAVLLLLKQQLLVSLLILSLTSLSFFTTLCSKRLWSSRRCLRRAAPSGDSTAAASSGVRGVLMRRPNAASAARHAAACDVYFSKGRAKAGTLNHHCYATSSAALFACLPLPITMWWDNFWRWVSLVMFFIPSNSNKKSIFLFRK